jgi:predicted porin
MAGRSRAPEGPSNSLQPRYVTSTLDSLTWHGITLYGVVDIGVQYDTHSAPFTPYRPAASGNIVRNNSRQSVTGLTPSNMGQSRVGLQGIEPLNDDWSAVFQIETFFNFYTTNINPTVGVRYKF